jgi:hypothetical protein
MKRTVWSLFLLVAAGLAALAVRAAAQEAAAMPQAPLHGYYTYGKLRSVTTDEAMRQSSAATTVPMWGYTVTASRDDNVYSGVMVGRSPFFHGARTTDIPVVIIPVKFTMTDHESGAQVFDPTATDPTCSPNGSAVTVFQNSPILNAVNFTMPFSGGINVGSGQYVDEFQRANFWSSVSVTGNRFHTTLSPVTTLPAQAVTVPSGDGKGYNSSDFGSGFCGHLGGLNGAWWDPAVFIGGNGGEAQTLISNLTTAGKISPTQFPIFLFYNVIMNADDETACGSGCALGYHNSEGNPVQTYGVADWDTTRLFTGDGQTTGNSSVMSHEVAEWMNDPLGDNPVPAWGHIGQQPGCQNNLEVGDALSGTIVPPVSLNGMSYDLQELVFFSWFYGAPSIAVDGIFSDNDTFTSDAGVVCE